MRVGRSDGAGAAFGAVDEAVDAAELALMDTDDERTQMAYATALSDYADAGGYDVEVTWDVCTTAALGVPYDRCSHRMLHTLSGGEQKRLALEALLRGPDEVLLLDEPDNYLDVPGKRWLEAALADSSKTVLFVSHDRELLARTATRVVTVEAHGAWVHGGGFSTYADARRARRERLEELQAIANSFPGVEKSFAVQAGREVRILVRPEEIDDLASTRLARDIVRKIEESLTYPGQIKVTVIRETRTCCSSDALPRLMTLAYTSWANEADAVMASPATTARMVAKATAEITARKIVPPSSNASSGAAAFSLPGAARIFSGPTIRAAP